MANMFKNELKTGLMVVFCIILLITLTLSVGKFSVFNKQYKLKVLFNWVSGLENDAPVRLNGVEVGKVEDVSLLYKGDETRVLVTAAMDVDAKVREDAKAIVTTLGLMGEKYLSLSAGSKGSPFLKPDSTIEGTNPTDMEELIDIGKRIASEVEATLGDIRKLTGHLDDMVVQNRADIDDIVDNLKALTQNFEEFSDDIKRNPWKLMVKGKEK